MLLDAVMIAMDGEQGHEQASRGSFFRSQSP